MEHRIISRAEWGAQFPGGSRDRALPCTELWGHHTVTVAPDMTQPLDDDVAAIRELERIGQRRFGAGISYTFLVTPIGAVFEGHGIHRVGTHTGGHNTVGAAIAFVGNYDVAELTPPQREATSWLIAHGFLNGWWDAGNFDGGHRDTKATACPGRFAYAALPAMNARAAEIVREVVEAFGKPAPAPAPAPKPAPAPANVAYDGTIWQLKKPLMRGQFVRQIQTLCNAFGCDAGRVDGFYGENTAAAVKRLQRKFGFKGKAVDGKWGPKTEAAAARALGL